MTIERNVNGTVITLKTTGRLDTSTAPALEEVIDGCAADIKELVLAVTWPEVTATPYSVP